MPGRWARVLAALRDAAAEQAELHERMWLLNDPWEEDYLHWVGEGDERRLQGRIPPPGDGRATARPAELVPRPRRRGVAGQEEPGIVKGIGDVGVVAAARDDVIASPGAGKLQQNAQPLG